MATDWTSETFTDEGGEEIVVQECTCMVQGRYETIVRLMTHDALGGRCCCFYMSPDEADRMADEMKRAAQSARKRNARGN